MNGLVEDDLRLVVGGELRELANKDCVYENSLEPFRVSRATGDVDNRGIDTLLLQVLLNTQRTSGVGFAPIQPPFTAQEPRATTAFAFSAAWTK